MIEVLGTRIKKREGVPFLWRLLVNVLLFEHLITFKCFSSQILVGPFVKFFTMNIVHEEFVVALVLFRKELTP